MPGALEEGVSCSLHWYLTQFEKFQIIESFIPFYLESTLHCHMFTLTSMIILY